MDAQPEFDKTQARKRAEAVGRLSYSMRSVAVWRYYRGLFTATYDAKAASQEKAMTCAPAKPAALERALAWLTRLGGKHGSQAPVQFTSRRSSAAGCNGVPTTGDPSLRQNSGTRTTVLWRSRLRKQASNTPAYIIKRREALHLTLDRKDLTCE
jgi:hypothetical protein